MRTKVSALLLAVFIVAASAGTREQGQQKAVRDGNAMLPRCKAAVRLLDGEKLDWEESSSGLVCTSYVAGLIDGYAMAKMIGESKTLKYPYCPPPTGWDNSQSVRIVTKWLSDNPDKLHEPANISFLIAMSKAFPCQQ